MKAPKGRNVRPRIEHSEEGSHSIQHCNNRSAATFQRLTAQWLARPSGTGFASANTNLIVVVHQYYGTDNGISIDDRDAYQGAQLDFVENNGYTVPIKH